MKQVYTYSRGEDFKGYSIEEYLPIVPGSPIKVKVLEIGIPLDTTTRRLCCEFYGLRFEDVKIAVFTMVEAGIRL